MSNLLSIAEYIKTKNGLTCTAGNDPTISPDIRTAVFLIYAWTMGREAYADWVPLLNNVYYYHYQCKPRGRRIGHFY